MSEPVLIEFKKNIDGNEYSVWGYPNALLAKNISKLYDGYFLRAEIKDNVTNIFWKSSHFFKREVKYIGKVIYDISSDTMIYVKQGFKSELHEFHKGNTIGLCWDVISQLRAKDHVRIEEPTEKPKGKNVYSILVSQLFEHKKAENYKKQVFVPIEEFKKEWVKITVKRKKRRWG